MQLLPDNTTFTLTIPLNFSYIMISLITIFVITIIVVEILLFIQKHKQ
jgi:hypothetical protein